MNILFPKRAGHSVALLRIKLAALLLACLSGQSTLAQTSAAGCGSLDNHYGPFDYLTQKNKLPIVEQFHFTPQVESLVSGKTSINVSSDLDYTLKVFPNHHRALISMMRLGERQKSDQPVAASYPVECYFERALRFRPYDSTARVIYATYLFKKNRNDEAEKQLGVASTSAEDNPFTHYNIGLIYLERKQYDQALVQAHMAYAMGFMQPELREQLKLRGKWQEPESLPTAK